MKYVYGKNEVLEPIDRDAYIYRLESDSVSLGSLVKERRFRKSLLIFDAAVRDEGLLGKIEAGFQEVGIEVVPYDAIEGRPCFRIVDDGYNRCLLAGCDSVVCVGGKAAVDVGKGINLLRFNGGNIEKYTNPLERRNTGSGLFCACRFEGTDEERIVELDVWDNKYEACHVVECYCNYDVKLLD